MSAPDITTIADNPECASCDSTGWLKGTKCPDCYDPLSYGAHKDYDAADFGPVPETDPAVVEALLQQQLNELHEAGFE